ncbi:hypothetical protein WOLCODRAFT_161116 [Wolfiporia cocos MD-104 SS10]|uniref:FYVE zinc finger domain-containing protein n=1 Tax=Wolfiporia cocos (strain MD-104) TaxID=742152 RepID=A0A2H3JDI5_WOLCO|nr:hypothetical protein WOLCODRAFT_161116 [Wolfiporia cocos MD-104 SS10]
MAQHSQQQQELPPDQGARTHAIPIPRGNAPHPRRFFISDSNSSSSENSAPPSSDVESDLLFQMDMSDRSAAPSRRSSVEDVRHTALYHATPQLPRCTRCGRQFSPHPSARAQWRDRFCRDCHIHPSQDRDAGTADAHSLHSSSSSSDGFPRSDVPGAPQGPHGRRRGRPFPAARAGPSSGQYPHGVDPDLTDILWSTVFVQHQR